MISSIETAVQRVISRDIFDDLVIKIATGDDLDMDTISDHLIRGGYQATDLDGVQAEDIDIHIHDYFEIIQQYVHWEEYLSLTTYIDPPIIETTFPAGAYDETVIQAPDYGVYRTSAGAEVRRLSRSETSSSMTESTAIAMAHASLATPVSEKTYLFETFYHPYVCEFVKYLNRDGIDGLLQRCVQMIEPLLFSMEFESALSEGVVPEELKQIPFLKTRFALTVLLPEIIRGMKTVMIRALEAMLGQSSPLTQATHKNDSGIFELNFRDERYLPFEGAGVISQWRIEMLRECNNFDFNTISDVILHMSCTARDGGAMLKEAAMEAVVDKFPKEGLVRLFSAKHEFPGEWHRFVTPAASDTIQVLELDLNKERFPYLFREKEIKVNTAKLFLKLKEGSEYEKIQPLSIDFNRDVESFEGRCKFTIEGSPVDGLPYCKPFDGKEESLGKWYIKVEEHEKIEVVEDILIVFEYSVS